MEIYESDSQKVLISEEEIQAKLAEMGEQITRDYEGRRILLVGVLKGAQHPNAAHLFAVFMTMPEAQQVWERAVGVSSALIPGTAYYQKAKGKQLIFMRKDQSEKVESLAKSYGKIIGIL